ncbi:unnamed protein product [Paramecium octaurelia]|uniref:Prolyl endopeptidase-like n=1 Tax=Paramecium octaurelia TaxID=43137 RepID=A0A8S1W5B8_PAROT|nr:unnamed protein product [Paramecium octaurelia]
MIIKRGLNFSRLIKEATKLIHGRQYIDHFWYLKSNPESLQPLIDNETQIKNSFYEQPQIKEIFNDYYQVSYGRKDGRTHDIPELYDEYEYNGRFAYFDTGNDYQIIERSLKGGDKEVVLDLKKIQFLKQYHATMKLTKLKISDDHKLIAFGVDLLNNEDIIWLMKYIDDERVFRTKLFDCFDAAFTKDNMHLVYTQYDDKFRPYRLMLHKLGTTQEEDELLFEEKDEQFYLDLQQTKDGKYFVLLSQTKQSNEVILIDREDPKKVQLLFSRKENAINLVHHHEEHGLYILTNKNSYDYKVLKQEGDKFVDFYCPQQGEVLQEVDLFHKHLVLYFTKESESFIKVISLQDKEIYNLFIPPSLVYTNHQQNKKNLLRNIYDRVIKKDKSQYFLNQKVQNEVLGATIEPGVNHNYKSDAFQFHLSTPLVYDQVYQYNLSNKQLSKLQDANLTGKAFKREEFTCTRYYAPSKDGTEIPITLVHHKDLQKNRQNKLLLHSYGAYGVPQEIPFNIVYLNALEKGWTLAYAHIRGGNERGQDWHRQAIQENKIKSIEDLLGCASYLIAEGYTHPSLLCGLGASAGATTLGAAINMRPDLWKCAVLLSPFLDVLGSLLDESLPLTKSDYLEFGNPNDKKIFDTILSYSPYENLKKQVYPAIYISAGTGDFRAPLWNVLKYTEKLKQIAVQSKKVETIGDHPLIIDINDGGHYGGAGAQSVIEERTRYMTFLDYYVGIGNKEITKKSLTQDIDESIQLADEEDKIQKQ